MNTKHFFAPSAWRLGGAANPLPCRGGAGVGSVTLLRRAATALLLCVMTMTVQTAWAQSGNWSDYRAADFSSINTSAKTISITTEAELALLAYYTSSGTDYTGYTITLTKDLDMSAHYWDKTIGTSEDNCFRGTFKGDNKTISGIKINSGDYYKGLFGFVGRSGLPGTIQNVTLASSTITGKNCVGGIVGNLLNGTVSNCHVLSSVSILASSDNSVYFGGIVGRTYPQRTNTNATIENCTSAASVTDNGHNNCSIFGGIVGYNYYYSDTYFSKVTGCFYYGTAVSASSEAGAIVGLNYQADGKGISNCYYNYPSTISGIGYGNTDNGPTRVYKLTLGTGATDLTISGNATYTHNGIKYYAANTTATVTLGAADKAITSLSAASGTISNVVIASDGHSATFTVGSSDVTDVTVSATVKTISGTTEDGLTWSLGGTNYTELTISGTGPMQAYGYTTGNMWKTKAPWGTDITSVTIGDGVTSIGNYAFIGCENVASVTIGSGVTSIGIGAINHCDQMTSVTLPASVTTIAYAAFENCQKLETIYINHDGEVSLTGNHDNAFNAPLLQYIAFPSPVAALANTKETGNWARYKDNIRARFGSKLFTATNEGGTPAYAITNESDLRNLAAAVNAGNNGSSKTFRQTDDITMTGGNFTPIGNSVVFAGTYDGGNKTISGLVVSETYYAYAGLIGRLFGGTVKNVILVSPNVTNSLHDARVGAVVSTCESKNPIVDNCHVINPTVSATGSGTNCVGAIIGQIWSDNATVTNCYFYDSNTDHNYAAYGRTANGATVTNVAHTSAITLGTDVTTTTPATDAANGFVYSGVSYYRQGLNLALTTSATPPTGYTSYTYTIDGSTVDNPLTVAAAHDGKTIALGAPIPDPAHFEQTATNEYTIKDATGWGVFCDLLAENDKGYFTGKTVVLDKDIAVTRMAGTDAKPFTGTFDGNHKKLTFDVTATGNYTAPFRNAEGTSSAHAVIQDLNVVTTITSPDYRHAAGLVAVTNGYLDVTDCSATVSITATKSSQTDLYPAGLVSQVGSSGTLAVSGCTVGGTITSSGQYASGMIAVVQGSASISGCTVGCTINTSAKYAGGYVGTAQGSTSITNCVSSVTINSSVSGDGTHGGFVGAQGNTLTIEGCVFNGKLLSTGTTATTSCGGFVGWKSGTVNISNSLYAPAALDTVETWIGSDDSYTFSRRSGTNITNCYYTQAFGTAQGLAAHTIEAGENVTVAHAGVATVYDVSGITAYKASAQGTTFTPGLLYNNNVLYAGSGEAVSLTLTNTPPTGYTFDSYTASPDGATLSGSANPYTLTMPDADVTISATFALLPAVSYIDGNGEERFKQPGEYTVLTGGGATTLAPGWYVVNSNITYTGTVTLGGNVNIILCDGCTMSIGEDADGKRINGKGINGDENYPLNIYGQSLDDATAGHLKVFTTGNDNIGIFDSPYIQHSGNVTVKATGSWAIETLGGVTVNGGTLNATSLADDAIYAFDGDIIINGGKVNTSSKEYALLNYCSDIIINGGQFEATDGAGILASNGTITLGWTNATDYIKAGSYSFLVNIAQGKTLCDEDGTPYSGTLENENGAFPIDGKTLTPAVAVTLADGITATGGIITSGDDNYAKVGATVTVSTSGVTVPEGYTLGGITVTPAVTVTDQGSGSYSFTVPAAAVSVSAQFIMANSIAYIDGNGVVQYKQPGEYTVLTGGGATTLAPGWYVVNSNIDYTGMVSVGRGSVNIILGNGCTMNIGKKDSGISGTNGIGGQLVHTSTLTIYGQSLDDDTAGHLNIYMASGGNYGIRVYGYYTQHSGNVSVTTEGWAMFGICAPNITLNGGSLNVNTKSNKANALYAYNNIVINGGKLDATVEGSNCYALNAGESGGNIMLGWTNASDYIHASSYFLQNGGTLSIAEGKAFIDAEGTPHNSGTVNASDINGKTLRPYSNSMLFLADDADNTAIISKFNGQTYNVTLAGRKLWKDGAWNTLVLPFPIADIEADGCPLKGATVRQLNDASISGTTLTLNFKTATTAIAAGVPYIVKWADGEAGQYTQDPVFQGVTIDAEPHNYDNKAGGDTNVRFIGTYDQKTVGGDLQSPTEDRSILFLGEANTLYYPSGPTTIGACRAYFKIGSGDALARQLTAFNFGFGEESTEVKEVIEVKEVKDNSWYSLDGVKLDGQPTKKGLYIHGSKKVVIP